MHTDDALTATFARDGLQIEVKVAGRFDPATAEQFVAEVATATRGRRREFCIDVRDVTEADASFVDAMLRIRADWGPVAILNPPEEVAQLLADAGADQVLVVRHR